MEEKEELKLKLIKHIIYNIFVFIFILVIFGMFIFFMVKNNVYSSVDKELYESKIRILELEEIEEFSLNDIFNRMIIPKDITSIFPNDNSNINSSRIKQRLNPNIIVILRDSDEKITNTDLGRLSEYSSEVKFDSKNLDKIYEITINEKYHYRGISFVLNEDPDSTNKYVQLLINVSSEKYLVSQYFQIIAIAVAVGCVISIFASYFLSKRTLKPLSDNLIKQMEFVQNVSHELRTPLTIIQAKQELLLQEPNKKIIDKTEEIALTLNETKRLSKLVQDLLILSRADSSKTNLQKENINIDEYIKEIITPYKEIAEMQEKEIALDLNYKMDINVDANKIYQLMIILLDNAIKYTEEKDKIEIKTYNKDNKCIIEVKDTGIGVSEEGLKRIFERFYREDRARSRESGGTGLGLSIANVIVTEHGGTIKASHNTPKGTIFTVKLPKN